MAGGGGGMGWTRILAVGAAIVVAGYAMHHARILPEAVMAAMLAVGGLMVVFGSCESMILCVEGIAARLRWNDFVAGTIAGIAGNVPELVMLGFVLAAKPRVGFIVVALTLHVGAMAFGVYSGLLPRDAAGFARLPAPLVQLSTDQFAGSAGVFLATGLLMVTLQAFDAGVHRGQGLGAADLLVMGGALLALQVVGTIQLVRRFGRPQQEAQDPSHEDPPQPPSPSKIALFGAVGIAASVLGGHAVGDFADVLVEGLDARGYPQMVGAIVLSVFACAGGYVMTASAHLRKKYDIALANVSGAVTQNAVLVMPVAMIMLAAFGVLGVIPRTESGAILPIDLETTSVVLLMFPPLLILWKAVKDDGKVNWLETAAMIGIFTLTLYFLAMHG